MNWLFKKAIFSLFTMIWEMVGSGLQLIEQVIWHEIKKKKSSSVSNCWFIIGWNLTIFSSLFQGEQGLVFKDLLRDLEQNIDPNVVFPWFHRVLTKDEAVKMLVRGKL